MKTMFNTINELENAIRNNDESLNDKKLSSVRTKIKYTTDEAIDMFNRLYASENVRLERTKIDEESSLLCFKLNTKFKTFETNFFYSV